ncbi:MAG: hypothetical protein IKD94_03410 [Erysipelotrichaceae bacterium]|nr:hypothetical protein [Erysipelotrichaceae bacterium]
MRNKILSETFPNRVRMSKVDIRKYLEGLLQKINRNDEPEDALIGDLKDGNVLDDLELSFLYLYLQMCYAREYKVSTGRYEVTETDVDLPCEIYFSKKYRCLLIDTPAMLSSCRNPSSKAQENLLKALVKSAVKKYEIDNGFDLTFSIRAPYSICLYRRCLPDQSSTLIPDIDNIEAGRIINYLAQELSLDDSYSSLISNVNSIEYVEAKEDCGTSILVIEEGKRNELEREFLKNRRSFSMIRKCR